MTYRDIKIVNVIVIYNMLITDSPSFKGLVDQLNQKTNILIVDNSTNENILIENEMITDKNFFCYYIGAGGNFGLSKAYNNVQKFRSQFEWVVFWDQDTPCPDKYMKRLRLDISNNKTAKLIVPTVYSKKNQMSPRRFKKAKITSPIKGNGFKKNATAINSGLAMEIKKFIEIGMYDERMFIDYLDHDLVIRYNERVGNIFISGNELQQNFSNDTHDNYQGDLFRFVKYIHDYKIFTDNVSGSLIFFWMKVFYRSIRLGIVYRRLSFIKEVFKIVKIK